MTDDLPHYQFYGRRKGHPLRRHHLELVDGLLPRLRIGLADPLAWRSDGRRPLVLEIGFGGGEHLAHQAKLHPGTDYIGAEPFINGVAKLLALIEAKGLGNIRILDGDARYLLEAMPDGSLDCIYLLYPDPWPKVRHHKRRFVNAETLAHFHRLLKSGGMFLFASDIADYVEWAERQVAERGGFQLSGGDRYLPPEGWVETRYEAKAKREGRVPKYLAFQVDRL